MISDRYHHLGPDNRYQIEPLLLNGPIKKIVASTVVMVTDFIAMVTDKDAKGIWKKTLPKEQLPYTLSWTTDPEAVMFGLTPEG